MNVLLDVFDDLLDVLSRFGHERSGSGGRLEDDVFKTATYRCVKIPTQ